jgi:hypothetical protein
MKIKKGATGTRIGGTDWRQFLKHNRLEAGEMVCFYLQGEFPKILIAFIDGGEGEDSGEGEDEDGSEGKDRNESDESEEDPFDAAIFYQRCNLCQIRKHTSMTSFLPSIPSSEFLLSPV